MSISIANLTGTRYTLSNEEWADYRGLVIEMKKFIANEPPALFVRVIKPEGEGKPREEPLYFCRYCHVRQERGKRVHLDGCIITRMRVFDKKLVEREHEIFRFVPQETYELKVLALASACESEWSPRITKPENRWSNLWWKILYYVGGDDA